MLKINNDDIQMLEKMANTIRFLSADMVQSANSGHPGAPMGLADIATMLSLYLNINPKNPKWLNRDRLVFSGGHASALVYSLLHLWGFEVSLQDLKSFRKIHSKTPGHPEYAHTSGIEITTGPLGQGFGNAVGFAMGAKMAENLLGKDVINHKIYCLCGDGDLQEGISYESASIAGHHHLNNLIVIYDSNHITIEGNTQIAFSEDVKMRFNAQNWNVLECDGHNFSSIQEVLNLAQDSSKPTLIIAKTTIAKGALDLEGSHKTHGSPLGEENIKQAKKALGFDENLSFNIPDDVLLRFRNVAENGELQEKLWEQKLSLEIKNKIQELQNPDFSKISYPVFEKGQKIATRASNGKILNAISKSLQGFIGGSADLSPSNNTTLEGQGDFPKGKNLHFGIREHSMGAICNALANYGLFLPYCGTFFVFSDYMSASVRVASIMKSKVFYIWTHDSIGVGEDGATHQPIEQLGHFRSMPNLYVFRPADGNENIACAKVALELQSPSAFILSRQNLPIISNPTQEQVYKGGYILKDTKNPKITLLATGSEVSLALDSANILEDEGISTRVVSVPCYDLFIKQDKSYIKSLFENTKVIAIEAARGLEWYRFAHRVIGMDSFGSSGKGEELFEYYGFNTDSVIKNVKELLGE